MLVVPLVSNLLTSSLHHVSSSTETESTADCSGVCTVTTRTLGPTVAAIFVKNPGSIDPSGAVNVVGDVNLGK